MKRSLFFLLACLLVPVYAGALTFAPGKVVKSSNKTLQQIRPRKDKQEDPTAVLFIKTNILHVSARGHVIGMPRRVNAGYVLFVPQGLTQLQLNAPLYKTQTIRFKPLQSGNYYEMTLDTQEDKNRVKEAARQSKELNLDHTQVAVELDFDYMEVPQEIHEGRGSLIYLDKTLDFAQWEKLLMPNGPYRPFDISGNEKNPCCIVVPAGTPLERVFRMRVLDMKSYVEDFESGNTYHATLTLTPQN